MSESSEKSETHSSQSSLGTRSEPESATARLPGDTPVAKTSEPLPPGHEVRFDPASVIWTALWSAVLSLGIAAGATMWEQTESRAHGRALLLLPSTESSETDRERWLQHLLEDLGFESGEWLSPKSLVQQVSETLPPEMWAELFSESDAWLPWLLRLHPGAPLEDVPAFRAQLENLRADPRFRLVLYDEAGLQQDAQRYQLIRRSTFVAAGIAMIVGALALLFSPFPARWRFDVPIGAILGGGLTALGWYGLGRYGLEVDREQGMRSMATAFGLAGLFGPMLKGRITQYLRKRGV